jgi:hypothetical protein
MSTANSSAADILRVLTRRRRLTPVDSPEVTRFNASNESGQMVKILQRDSNVLVSKGLGWDRQLDKRLGGWKPATARTPLKSEPESG